MDRSFIVYRIAKLDFNTTYRRFSSAAAAKERPTAAAAEAVSAE